MTVSDDMAEAATRHAVYLERYKARVVREVLEAVDPLMSEIEASILKANLENMNRRELDRLLAQIRQQVRKGYDPIIEILDGKVRELGEYEADWQVRTLGNLTPVSLDFVSPSPEQIYAAATARPFNTLLLREWYRGLPDGAFRRIRGAIRDGYLEGVSTPEIVRRVMREGQQTRRAAETATRTAIAHTANVARNETYRANRRLLKGVEWISTLDNRTSAICMARDGKVFPVDSGPRPPAHPNCRSSTIPVLKSARALGLKNLPQSTRASMNGQVSAELNYDDWLRTQSREFQDEVLGPSRAEIFRSGRKLDRFVDRSGREYTLDELRQQDNSR